MVEEEDLLLAAGEVVEEEDLLLAAGEVVEEEEDLLLAAGEVEEEFATVEETMYQGATVPYLWSSLIHSSLEKKACREKKHT